jgi:hypothetical protein
LRAAMDQAQLSGLPVPSPAVLQAEGVRMRS